MEGWLIEPPDDDATRRRESVFVSGLQHGCFHGKHCTFLLLSLVKELCGCVCVCGR